MIADLHFGGENIIRYENRPFSSVEEMTQVLIDNWNAVVTEEDTVFVLGDFSTGQSKEQDASILKRLKGRKILVMGNHDTHRTPEEWRGIGFAECSLWPIVYREFFILSHEPMYLNRNMPYANLFGHVHNTPIVRDYSSQHFCVSAERIDYTPIPFSRVVEKVKEASEHE